MNDVKYVLTEIDKDTGSFRSDYRINNSLKDEIMQQGIAINELIDIDMYILRSIKRKLNIKNRTCILRKLSRQERALSYQLHTNRELLLMTEGKKDFSVFSSHVDENHSLVGFQKFENYKQYIISREIIINSNRFIFYYFKGKQWKIKCYLRLLEARKKLGNSDKFEFIEGRLLGYSRDQCKEFINKFPK